MLFNFLHPAKNIMMETYLGYKRAYLAYGQLATFLDVQKDLWRDRPWRCLDVHVLSENAEGNHMIAFMAKIKKNNANVTTTILDRTTQHRSFDDAWDALIIESLKVTRFRSLNIKPCP